MNVFKNIVFSFLGVFTCTISAAGGINANIKSINIKETGYVFIGLTAPHNNPDGCERNDVVVFPNAHIAKTEMLSVSLAAMTSNKTSNFWLTGCYSAYGTTYPIAITAAIKN